MSTKFRIGTIVRGILLQNTTITNTIGDAIFPVVAMQGVDGDFIVYVRDSYSKKRNNMGHTEECGLYIVCCSKSYDRSIDLAESVNEVCEGLKVPGMIREMLLADSSEDFESDIYMQILLFDIK